MLNTGMNINIRIARRGCGLCLYHDPAFVINCTASMLIVAYLADFCYQQTEKLRGVLMCVELSLRRLEKLASI
jgi:hypothetical protein